MNLQDAERWRRALKNFMEWYGINQSEWCRRSGVAQKTLNNFLTGENNNITYGTLEKLARGLGVTVGMIMGEVKLPGMTDSANQDYEDAPPGILAACYRMLHPDDVALLESAKDLTPAQKKMLSRMSKALPDDPDSDKSSANNKKRNNS